MSAGGHQIFVHARPAVGEAQTLQPGHQSLPVVVDQHGPPLPQQQCLEQAIAEVQSAIGKRQRGSALTVDPDRGEILHRARQSDLLNSRVPLVPPKPKELESTL